MAEIKTQPGVEVFALADAFTAGLDAGRQDITPGLRFRGAHGAADQCGYPVASDDKPRRAFVMGYLSAVEEQGRAVVLTPEGITIRVEK